MSPKDYILRAEKLRKEFGSLVAVRDVSLTVERGHMHSIIGPNGAGKTTFFNLLSGNLFPTSGQLHYNDMRITNMPLNRRAHIGIGRSFQITNIFPTRTVFENVRLAATAHNSAHRNLQRLQGGNLRQFADIVVNSVRNSFRSGREIEERAFEAIDIAGLTGKERLLGSMLAHGDQRKLELAMIVASDPELMLLDEPTAGMATEQVPEVIATIDKIRHQGNRTVMLVEHNMSVVMSISDRITVMHQGAVLAEGTPREISENQDVQSAYLGELYGDLMETATNE
jgi:branched-chain amino acid transport system ATP-binding protein